MPEFLSSHHTSLRGHFMELHYNSKNMLTCLFFQLPQIPETRFEAYFGRLGRVLRGAFFRLRLPKAPAEAL